MAWASSSLESKVWWMCDKPKFQKIILTEGTYKEELAEKSKVKWSLEIEPYIIHREEVLPSFVASTEKKTMTWCNRLWRISLIRSDTHSPVNVKATMFFGADVFTNTISFLGESKKLIGKVDTSRLFTCELDLCLHFTAPSNKIEFQKIKISKLPALSEDLKKLLASGLHADVHLKCGGKVIKAHRSVLSARSGKLKEDLQKDCIDDMVIVEKDGLRQHDINDLDFEILRVLVSFMYTGEVVLTSYKMAINILIAAHRYKVTQLPAELEKIMRYYQ